MPNYCLTLCYDGTRFRGWQRQGNTPNTIQALVETALSDVLEQPVEAQGSGRTDAGVHARMQTVSFRARTKLSPETILKRLRAALPADVGAVALQEAPPRFHARLSCTGKTYVYRIWNSAAPNVFDRRWQHTVAEPLDLAAMRRAGEALCGTHDFTSFCANRRMKKSAVRTLRAVAIERAGDEVRLAFTGDGFLYHMARILAGTLIEIGLGRRSADDIPAILAAQDRSAAGETAPAKGLILWEATYA